MRQSKSIRFFDFSGGLNTKSPGTSLAANQAIDLQNINLLPSGGFEKRRGNSVFNSSAMASGASIHGLGYFRKSDATEFLVSVAGTKIFTSPFDGTMTDRSASLTITTGNNNIWTSSVMNDLIIFVGGARASDVPIKWSGSGNAAVLGGTPPVGEFGIVGNNRFFIGNTISNPSRIAWSILGNPEDWTGTGSGTQDVSTNDGDTLVGAALLGYDHLLLFKQNSIHDLSIRTSPFPLYPLFRNVGAISKRGIVEVNGIVYFITPGARMKATDGTRVYDAANPGPTGITDFIDDIWDSLITSRLPYLHGTYYRKLNQIWWVVSSSAASTHDVCIKWDLARKAWLYDPTGFKMNAMTVGREAAYGGAYNGIIYQQDVSGIYADASETSPGAISAYWRTGWQDVGQMIQAKSFPYLEVNFVTQTAGTMEFGYGYDFSGDRAILPISMISTGAIWDLDIWNVGAWGSFTDRSKLVFTKGKGKFIQFLLRNKNASEQFAINGFEVPIKANAPEALKA